MLCTISASTEKFISLLRQNEIKMIETCSDHILAWNDKKTTVYHWRKCRIFLNNVVITSKVSQCHTFEKCLSLKMNWQFNKFTMWVVLYELSFEKKKNKWRDSKSGIYIIFKSVRRCLNWVAKFLKLLSVYFRAIICHL